MTINDMTEGQLKDIREYPIEDMIQKARDAFYELLPVEPPSEGLTNMKSLLVAAEKALECILDIDSKVRPTHEWLAALDQVEAIRDEAKEMIEVLRNIR